MTYPKAYPVLFRLLSILLITSQSLIIPTVFAAEVAPEMQHNVYKEEKKSADKSSNGAMAMTVVHGVVAAVCVAACAAMWAPGVNGAMQGVCTVGSLGAGVSEMIVTGNIASAGAAAAITLVKTFGFGGVSGLSTLASSMGIGGAAATKEGTKAGSKSANAACVTGVVEAAFAVMDGMTANDAKKSAKAAQANMDKLASNGNAAVSTNPLTNPDTTQTGTNNGGAIQHGTGDQLANDTTGITTNSPEIHTANGSDAANSDACGNISTYQHAVTCALATDSRIPAVVGDPRFEEQFKKLTGMDPVAYFKDKDPAQAIGGAVGSPGLLDAGKLAEIANALNSDQGSPTSGIGVAGGGGGSAKPAGDNSANDLAALFGAKGDDGKAAGFERKQFGEASRDLAALSDDPRVSIFERVTYRYQVVTKRWLSMPADGAQSNVPDGKKSL